MIQQKFDDIRYQSLKRQTATKIIDTIEKLKNDSTPKSSKRWIWELLQNTHDASYSDEKLDVYIRLTTLDNSQSILEYMHNGKVFNAEHLVCLIDQVSSKDRNENRENISGKFGTGFLTTYLLSLKVGIEGLIQVNENQYKNFSVDLDRTSSDIDTLIDSIEVSTKQIYNADHEPFVNNFDKSEFNTKFTYYLDEKGRKIAESGLKDLVSLIPYTMVFLDKFNTLTVEYNGIKTFEIRLKEMTEMKAPNYSQYCLDIYHKGLSIENRYLKIENEFGEILCEIDNSENFKFKKIEENIPRLFARFPLIGTEELPFQVIYNSWRFYVTEPRDGILLFEEENHHVKENRKIMIELSKLFLDLLNKVSKTDRCMSVFNILPLNQMGRYNWISEDWLKKEIIGVCRKHISTLPILYSQKGEKINMYSAENINVFLPEVKNEENLRELWNLFNSKEKINLFKIEEISQWSKIIWDSNIKVGLERLVKDLEEKKNLAGLDEELRAEISPVDWLNNLYSFKEFDINANIDKNILLNQEKKLVSYNELSVDVNLPEELKKVLKYFGENLYECLLHLDIEANFFGNIPKLSTEDLIEKIHNQILSNEYIDFPKAFDYLISLIPNEESNERIKREEFYETLSRLLVNTFDKTIISYDINKLWLKMDYKIAKYICDCINEYENIEKLSIKLNFKTCDQTIRWMDSFIKLLTEHQLTRLYDSSENRLFPNQNGRLISKDNIYLEPNPIPEELKDILESLGLNIREELLDLSVFLQLQNRDRDSKYVAENITKLIMPLISQYPRTSEATKILLQLYTWFTENKEIGKELFDKLYDDRHRLCDDEIIATNVKKAEQLDKIFEEYNIQDIESLKNILSYSEQEKKERIDKQKISTEILVNLGITTLEELEAAFTNTDLQSEFLHTSVPSPEMFRSAQEKIKRAKDKVIEFLKEAKEYDLTNFEEHAPTILAGVKKNGQDIQIVIRPSDNDMVIIYSENEKNVLDYVDSELWIDNGVSSPIQLTLGKLFKSAKINRIPLKK